MSDVQGATQEESYRAAVGPKKADYYVPRFLKFDQPGASRVSWNWPAFFLSFWWLLYRRMYGYALTYFFVVLATGASPLVISQNALSLVVSLAAYIVIPMFANALYHRHVKRVIARKTRTIPAADQLLSELQRGPHTTHAAWIAVPAAVIGIGVFASVAIPAYQDYTVRTQVAAGLNLADGIKAGVAKSFAQDGVWPGSLTDIGINERISGKYVAEVSVENGTISIHYGGNAHQMLSGRVLTLRPSISREGEVIWNCGYVGSQGNDPLTGPSGPDGTNVPEKYVPAACRTWSIRTIDPGADP